MPTTTIYQAFNKNDFDLDHVSTEGRVSSSSWDREGTWHASRQMKCLETCCQGVLSDCRFPFIFVLLQCFNKA